MFVSNSFGDQLVIGQVPLGVFVHVIVAVLHLDSIRCQQDALVRSDEQLLGQNVLLDLEKYECFMTCH